MKKIILLIFINFFISMGYASLPNNKLTVILDWFPNPDHAPLIIAKQKGFFKEQGLEVELIGPADPNDPPKLVAANKADIGITYEPQFMEQIDKGLPLDHLGILIDKPLNCLVTLKSSHINTLSDLKSKRIGTTSGGLSSIMLKKMLANSGLSEKEVKIVNVRYNLTQALLTHKVDAVTGMMRNFEVPQIELNGQKVNVFFPEKEGIPNYSELIFIINANHKNDPLYHAFLTAVKKAVAYIKTYPKESWEQFATLYPESKNEVNRIAWYATLPYFANDPGKINASEWENFATFMRNNGMIR